MCFLEACDVQKVADCAQKCTNDHGTDQCKLMQCTMGCSLSCVDDAQKTAAIDACKQQVKALNDGGSTCDADTVCKEIGRGNESGGENEIHKSF